MRLRPMLMSDADFMLELKNDPETRRFAIVSHEKITKEDHYRWLVKNIDCFEVICGGGGPVGAIRIYENELSIWIARQYWGLGIATNIIRMVATQGMYAKIVEGNVASLRAFIKAGFLPVEYIDKYYILVCR